MGLPHFDAIVAHAVRRPADLGTQPGDLTRLRDSPALAHLADALPVGIESARAMDLAASRLPRFTRAPRPPTATSEPRSVAAPEPEPDAAQLRVLSFNCALLDRPYLWTRATMPHYRERAAALPDRLLGDRRYGLLLLQEVWDDIDAERFVAAGHRHGYTVLPGSRKHHREHGLLVCIRTDLMTPGARLSTAEGPFAARYALEEAPGPGIRRAWLSARFEHARTGRPLTLLNTHLTPFPEFWRQRAIQARTLGLVARRAPAGDLVVVGGDLNAGPYYANDVHAEPDGRRVAGWWQNASAHALALHYGALRDCMAVAGQARDVEHADTWASTGSIERGTFTATDANSLHRHSYDGTEQPARLDHLLLRQGDAAAVRGAHVVLTEPEELGAPRPIELSDHYGVEAELTVAPLRAGSGRLRR